MFAEMTVPVLPTRAHTLYVGCRDLPAVTAVLTSEEYAYEPADFEAGLDLVEAVEDRGGDREREEGEQYLATEKAAAALAELSVTYTRHRRLGRAKHPRGSAAYRALNLAGEVPDDDEGLYAAADAFYRAIEADPTLAAGVRGLGPAAVSTGRARVAAARAAMDAQAQETGEARLAGRLHRDEVARLRAHAGELANVCAVAFADRPDLLAQLGLR